MAACISSTSSSKKASSLVVVWAILLCLSYNFRAANSFVMEPVGYRANRCYDRHVHRSGILRARSSNDDDPSFTEKEEEEDDTVEVFLAMEEASKRTTNRLMMPRRILTSISQTVTFFAYAFLIVSFGLNIVGKSLIADDNGGFRIGTMEDQAFQMEIRKSMKERPPPPVVTNNSNDK